VTLSLRSTAAPQLTIHEKAGRKPEARAQFEAALRLRPGDKNVKEALKRVS